MSTASEPRARMSVPFDDRYAWATLACLGGTVATGKSLSTVKGHREEANSILASLLAVAVDLLKVPEGVLDKSKSEK